MKAMRLISAYITGSKLDRFAIRTKLVNRVGFNKYKIKDYIYTNLVDVSKLMQIDTIEEKVYMHYMRHEFNFLGLGWKNWNRKSQSTNDGYAKIAWNTDVKSGYIFATSYDNSDFLKGIPQGTDIKNSWELARMQHWPQLALYGLCNNHERQKIQIEFRNQMRDFIECNPVGKGIHFFCAMEIAIRAINLMISYDIISQYEDISFDEEFVSIFETYLYSHYQAIINRLEKNYFTGHTGNHYLTNLCGLLWISMYFKSVKTKRLLAAVIEELRKEEKRQFIDSGSNFECSTGYHILASEILGLSFFAIGNIDDKELQNKDIERLSDLKKILNIFEARDHRIIQIGDNDSGRVLKLNPLYIGEKEDCLNPIEVKGMLDYMTSRTQSGTYSMLLESYHPENNVQARKDDDYFDDLDPQMVNDSEYMYKKSQTIDVGLGNIIRINKIHDFGLLKVKCEHADVYIRTVPDYKQMDTSHAHDDVFSYQIITDKQRIHEDLGSIVYTSDKAMREYYACARSHGIPEHSIAMVKRLDTFKTSVSVVGYAYIEGSTISVEARWDGIAHKRVFVLDIDKIQINDFSNEDFEVHEFTDKYYSLGYGQLYER